MVMNKALVGMGLALLLGLAGCSRQQSDWEKTRASNTTDSYEQFLKKYPSGEFTAQAQARVKDLYEERDWQKARDTDTQEAYQAFLKQYPEGKWTEEARIRVENFTLAQTPQNGTPGAAESGNASPSAAGGDGTSTAPAPATAAAKPPTAPPPSSMMMMAAKPTTHAATPAAKAAAGEGAYGIQLGAFKSSADAANRRWSHLEKEYPKALAGLSPTVSPKKGASGTLYRLQSQGITESHARAVCASLKAKSQPCVVIHPGKA
jgi:cell division protein FtsN